MAIVVKPITVEVSKPNVFQAIAAKQNDCNSRFLQVTFANEGEKIDIPLSAKVTINAERKDGQSNSFFGVVNGDGTVTVPIHSWILELPGYVDCDVSIIEEDSKLTCTTFSLLVEEASHNSDDISEDEQYDVLTELINKAEGGGSDVASAIVGTANGSTVVLPDISPINHTLSTKVTLPTTYECDQFLYSDYYCESTITEWVDFGDATGEDVPVFSSGYFIVKDINKFISSAKEKGIEFTSTKEFVVGCDFSSDRENAIYNKVYYDGELLADETYSEFISNWGIDFEYTQNIASEAYTKFMVTDFDVSAVTLYAEGKNLLSVNHITTPTDEKTVLFEGKITGNFVFSADVNCDYTHETASLFEVTVDGAAKHITPSAIKLYKNGFTLSGTVTKVILANYCKCGEGSIDNIQLEHGTSKTAYEPHIEPTAYQIGNDGTIEGVRSIYPTTTLYADTEGITLDVTYNVDTKKYIDKKIAEIAAVKNI